MPEILKAEETYSNDILLSVSFEIRDVFPSVSEPLYGFIGCPIQMETQQVLKILKETGFSKKDSDLDQALRLIVWFGFLGVKADGQENPTFIYQARQNIEKLLAPIKQGRASFVIHPAFRKALECRDTRQEQLLN